MPQEPIKRDDHKIPRFGNRPGDPLMFHPSPGRGNAPDRQADVAQLVAHHLAKVRVAGSNPVVRSEWPSQVSAGPTRWSGREARQRPAKPCTRVQIPSPPRRKPRAIGAAGARFLDTEEVTGSIPVSPTSTLIEPDAPFGYPVLVVRESSDLRLCGLGGWFVSNYGPPDLAARELSITRNRGGFRYAA